MADVVIGVDIGTGAARAVAIDRDGTVRGTGVAGYQGTEDWPAGRAQSGAWLAACRHALADLSKALGGAPPVAVAVGGQSPTTVAVDGGLAVTIRHPAGNDLDNDARQHAQRHILEEERGAAVAPRQLWDWLLASLGASDAQGRWPGDPTLESFGPRQATGSVVGTATGAPGLPAGTPLVTGAQDAFLAFWAGGLDRPGRALDPGGRTGGLAVAVPAGLEAQGLWTFPSAAMGVDIAGGPVNAHGLAVEWLAGLLGRPPEAVLELAAQAPAGARGVLFLPYLEGERAPRWDARLRGLFAGLHGAVTGAELSRAVVEGTAYGLAHVAAGLRDAGARIDVLVCAGAPARSALWCAVKGAVLGVEVEIPEHPDLAAYGAALAAGAGAGWWPRPGEGAPGAWPHPAMRRIPPLPRNDLYAEQLHRFVRAGNLVHENPDLFGASADPLLTRTRS